MFSQPTNGPAIVAHLLKQTATANLADPTGVTLLHTAAAKNDLAVCTLLLKGGASPTAVDKVVRHDVHPLNHVQTPQEGATPLHACCSLQGDHAELVEVLVDHGAPVDAIDMHGMTPLAHCAMVGAVQSASLLLQREADADVQDEHGRTALHMASKHGCTELAALLATFTDIDTVTKVVSAYITFVCSSSPTNRRDGQVCIMHASISIIKSRLRWWRLAPMSTLQPAQSRADPPCWWLWSRRIMTLSKCCWIMVLMWRLLTMYVVRCIVKALFIH